MPRKLTDEFRVPRMHNKITIQTLFNILNISVYRSKDKDLEKLERLVRYVRNLKVEDLNVHDSNNQSLLQVAVLKYRPGVQKVIEMLLRKNVNRENALESASVENRQEIEAIFSRFPSQQVLPIASPVGNTHDNDDDDDDEDEDNDNNNNNNNNRESDADQSNQMVAALIAVSQSPVVRPVVAPQVIQEIVVRPPPVNLTMKETLENQIKQAGQNLQEAEATLAGMTKEFQEFWNKVQQQEGLVKTRKSEITLAKNNLANYVKQQKQDEIRALEAKQHELALQIEQSKKELMELDKGAEDNNNNNNNNNNHINQNQATSSTLRFASTSALRLPSAGTNAPQKVRVIENADDNNGQLQNKL